MRDWSSVYQCDIDNHTSLAQITNTKCLTQLVAAAAATQSTGKATDHYNRHSDTMQLLLESKYNLRCDYKCMYWSFPPPAVNEVVNKPNQS